jgi:hypothetical protein
MIGEPWLYSRTGILVSSHLDFLENFENHGYISDFVCW